MHSLKALFWSSLGKKECYSKELSHSGLASVIETIMGSRLLAKLQGLVLFPVINMQLMTQAIKLSSVPFPAE